MGSDTSAVVWRSEPHTEAKHHILGEYLKAWFPILGNSASKIVYADGFAGPGVYKGGNYGSPIIALDVATKANVRSAIMLIFIEENADRADTLKRKITKMFPTTPSRIRYDIINGKFADNVNVILGNIKRGERSANPAFVFLDPFGYSLSMKDIASILKIGRCEVLITFMSSYIIRFTDKKHRRAITDLFGTEKWVSQLLKSKNKEKDFLRFFGQELKNNGAEYVKTFTFSGNNRRTIYSLVFATKHKKGIKEMERAMRHVDRRGTHKFSDKDEPGQSYIMDFVDNEDKIKSLANALCNEFGGSCVSIEAVEDFSASKEYRYHKKALKYLEKQNPPKIKVNGRKSKALTYPDGCKIVFS